jgi:hypothetical protein
MSPIYFTINTAIAEGSVKPNGAKPNVIATKITLIAYGLFL